MLWQAAYLVVLHKCFHVIDVVGDAVFADEATTVMGDEHVVFYAYATEVLVGFELVVTQEVFAMAFGAPFVNEGGNEVDAWFVGNDKAFFESAAHAQTVGAKLFEVRTGFFVKAHVDLVERFHVVYVHSHHVAQAVGKEHGMCACCNSCIGVAFGQAKLFQTVKHQAADGKVNIGIFHARTGQLEGLVVAGLNDSVDFFLSLGELSAYGHGARVVRTVVFHGFGTSITEGEASGFEYRHRGVAVHDLSVLRVDSRKRHHRTVAMGDAVHLSTDKLLGNAGLGEAHGGGVHLVANDSGPLQLVYFLGCLGGTHLHNGTYKVHRGAFLLLVRMDAEQVEDLNLYVCTVGRQEVDASVLTHGGSADSVKRCHRGRVGHSHLGRHVAHSVYRAIPYDVVNVYIVAHKGLLAALYINHTYQSVALLPEIVEERRVLAEWIETVCREVGRRFVVAEQEDDTVFYEFAQLGATVDVGFFAEHLYTLRYGLSTKLRLFAETND